MLFIDTALDITPVNDREINTQLNNVLSYINSEPSWTIRVWNMQGTDYDTSFAADGDRQYTYKGSKCPRLIGHSISGQDLNYIGVGEGFAANGFNINAANFMTSMWYSVFHGTPDTDALTAMNAGYDAYTSTH